MTKEVVLDSFIPREYQEKFVQSFDTLEYNKYILLWHRRCLSGNSFISMADGSLKQLKLIKVGDKVLSWNGETFETDIVVDTWKTEPKEVIQICSKGTHSVITSKDHKFALDNGSWGKASELDGKTVIKFDAFKALKMKSIDQESKNYFKCKTLAKIRVKHLHRKEDLFDIKTLKHHNFIANGFVVHNSGKDICAFNLVIRHALRKVGNYFYILPTFAQCRRVIWNSITDDGKRIIDYIPEALIKHKNAQELRIELINGSMIQLCGSDNYDRLMGVNFAGAVFSEFALQRKESFNYLHPIMSANGAWSVYISTARGKNFFYTLWNSACNYPEHWFSSKLTLEDTGVVTPEQVEKDIEQGVMSYELSRQEWYCDFNVGIEGTYYGKYIDKMRLEGRIKDVYYDPSLPVNTSFDLGIADLTAIIFFQVTPDNSINIINYYENNRSGLEHYIKEVLSKPYMYNCHVAPHDIRVQEFGSGVTRFEKAARLGLHFTIADSISIEDGIEAVWSILPRVCIDQTKCKQLIKHLENYRRQYDKSLDRYRSKPVHDISSNAADALRYLAISLYKLAPGLSTKEIESLKQRAKMRRLGVHDSKRRVTF